MRIIETGLQFGGLQARSKTDLIVLHHSASADVSAAEIHGWHRAKGWAGIKHPKVEKLIFGDSPQNQSEWRR